MAFINKTEEIRMALSLWQYVVDSFNTLLTIALKSLWYGPLFYGLIWLTDHHAPSRDMWVSFFFGAFFFTRVIKKTKSDANKEQPQRPVSPIVLTASKWEK